jgi:hypothetical protein
MSSCIMSPPGHGTAYPWVSAVALSIWQFSSWWRLYHQNYVGTYSLTTPLDVGPTVRYPRCLPPAYSVPSGLWWEGPSWWPLSCPPLSCRISDICSSELFYGLALKGLRSLFSVFVSFSLFPVIPDDIFLVGEFLLYSWFLLRWFMKSSHSPLHAYVGVWS